MSFWKSILAMLAVIAIAKSGMAASASGSFSSEYPVQTSKSAETLVKQIYHNIVSDQWQLNHDEQIFSYYILAMMKDGAEGYQAVEVLGTPLFTADMDPDWKEAPSIRLQSSSEDKAVVVVDGIWNPIKRKNESIIFYLNSEVNTWKIYNIKWSWHDKSLIELLEEPMELSPIINPVIVGADLNSREFGPEARRIFRAIAGRWAVARGDSLRCRKPDGNLIFNIDKQRDIGELVIDSPRKSKMGAYNINIGKVYQREDGLYIFQSGKERLVLQYDNNWKSINIVESTIGISFRGPYYSCSVYDQSWETGIYGENVETPAARHQRRLSDAQAQEAQQYDAVSKNALSVVRISQKILRASGRLWESSLQSCIDLDVQAAKNRLDLGPGEVAQLAYRNAAYACLGMSQTACAEMPNNPQVLTDCSTLKSVLGRR